MNKILSLFFLTLMSFTSSAFADFDAGVAAYNKNDYQSAIREWQPLAEGGNALAQNGLGVLYAHGRGVPMDLKQAVKWYRVAAEQGSADAQNNLAVKYEYGQGVAQDYTEAVKWYRLAAEQGNANAQFNLGVKYDHGQGVPQDYKEAIRWYGRAAEQGHAIAQNNLGVRFQANGNEQGNNVIAYALYNLSASNTTSSDNKAAANRTALMKVMSVQDIETAQSLTLAIAKPGNLLNALAQQMKHPAITRASKPVTVQRLRAA